MAYLLPLFLLGTFVSAQNRAADQLLPMLNQLASSTGSDIQALSYCRISTHDLISTAQSTANRVLQGVCNPRELNDKFTSLETQIVDQFNVLKTMVLNIEDQLRTQDKALKRHQGKLRQSLKSIRGGSNESPGESGGAAGGAARYAPVRKSASSGASPQYTTGNEIDDDDYYDQDYDEPEVSESPRHAEVERFNSTMHQEDSKRVFTYYWKVHDVNYKMKNWGWRRSLRSESFYIYQNGYRMYMRIYPNHNGENMFIHVGLTQGDYDDRLDWPFKLKHKINVLDHQVPAEDIASRVWDPTQLCSGWHWRRPDAGDNYECVGLGFEQAILSDRGYTHGDSITIKLTVYLI